MKKKLTVKHSGGLSPLLKGKKLLIADDDSSIRDVLKIILDSAGYEVQFKPDGADILINKFEIPDLFLIDKQLSGYNGLDICRYLKKQEQTKNIPLIMISASPDIRKLSQEAGADSYVEKPFEVKELLKKINTYLEAEVQHM